MLDSLLRCLCQFTLPWQQARVPVAPYPYQHLVVSVFFTEQCWWVFMSASLWFEFVPFHVFLALWLSLSAEWSFRWKDYCFSYWFVAILYILWLQVQLLDRCSADVFFHSVPCFFWCNSLEVVFPEAPGVFKTAEGWGRDQRAPELPNLLQFAGDALCLASLCILSILRCTLLPTFVQLWNWNAS